LPIDGGHETGLRWDVAAGEFAEHAAFPIARVAFKAPRTKAQGSAEVSPGASERAGRLLLCLNAGPFVDLEAPTP